MTAADIFQWIILPLCLIVILSVLFSVPATQDERFMSYLCKPLLTFGRHRRYDVVSRYDSVVQMDLVTHVRQDKMNLEKFEYQTMFPLWLSESPH